MNTQAQHVLKFALGLPETDRAELAASLIESLDTTVDENRDAAWSVEIKRRLESIDRGEVELVPWEDVMREMRSSGDG